MYPKTDTREKGKCECCEKRPFQHCPTCLDCGGRYLRAIKRVQGMTLAAKQAWLRKALADWMAFGHSEKALRELAKRGR